MYQLCTTWKGDRHVFERFPKMTSIKCVLTCHRM